MLSEWKHADTQSSSYWSDTPEQQTGIINIVKFRNFLDTIHVNVKTHGDKTHNHVHIEEIPDCAKARSSEMFQERKQQYLNSIIMKSETDLRNNMIDTENSRKESKQYLNSIIMKSETDLRNNMIDSQKTIRVEVVWGNYWKDDRVS